MIKNISVIGLGKLGASMAAGFASRGFDVIGLDVNKAAVDAINAGHAPVQETGLDEMIRANRSRLRATLSCDDAVAGSDISFVIVPTPSDSKGAFSLKYASMAFKEIGKALAKKQDYHVVVLTSTVLPGSIRQKLLPIIEKESGKVCGLDFGFCYNPEFIALGSVIRDFLNPDFFLVGEFDRRSGDALETVNSRTAMNKATCKRMSIENAELAKVSLNSYVTMKISFANMLADICERIPGGNVDVVSDAIGVDTRIGRKYLTGGLGFGGPCFPRDNIALSYIGRALGARCDLVDANDLYNRTLSQRAVEKLKYAIGSGSTVAVLGLAYKPLSHVVEESAGIFLAMVLARSGYRVVAHDPLAGEAARQVLGADVQVVDSIPECVGKADAVIVTTPDVVYKSLSAVDLLTGKSCLTVVDCWRCLREEVISDPRIKYIALGRCMNDNAATEALRTIWA